MKYLIVVISFLIISPVTCQVESIGVYYQNSIDAYEAKNYDEFLEYSIKVNQIRPNHPVLSYNLAAAYSLTNQLDSAIVALKRNLGMNANLQYLEDPDFINLRERADFKSLKALVEDLNMTVENSHTTLKLSQKENHFESITHDPMSNSFYLGSVRTRKVLKYENGRLDEYFSNERLFAVMGLDVDKRRNILWVCSAALPEIEGYKDSLENISTVFAIDLYTNEVIKNFVVPNAILGDIIVDKSGKALASDSHKNRLYQFSTSGFQVLLKLPNYIINLQGLALNKKTLYVSDYLSGLYRIDMVTQDVVKINNNGYYSDKGIDGLLYHKGNLIAFQIGTNPRRTFGILVEKDRVKGAKLIDQNLPLKGEATQGVIVNNELVFIGNSAWNAYEKGTYNSDLAEDLNIRKMELVNFLIE